AGRRSVAAEPRGRVGVPGAARTPITPLAERGAGARAGRRLALSTLRAAHARAAARGTDGAAVLTDLRARARGRRPADARGARQRAALRGAGAGRVRRAAGQADEPTPERVRRAVTAAAGR